jgi:hypothetical protein
VPHPLISSLLSPSDDISVVSMFSCFICSVDIVFAGYVGTRDN